MDTRYKIIIELISIMTKEFLFTVGIYNPVILLVLEILLQASLQVL